jgi:hypothetical protein
METSDKFIGLPEEAFSFRGLIIYSSSRVHEVPSFILQQSVPSLNKVKIAMIQLTVEVLWVRF